MSDGLYPVGPIELVRNERFTELNGIIGGEHVFYRFFDETAPRECIIEPFLAAAILDAMKDYEAIEFSNGTISSKLFDQLNRIQGLYACWNRDLKCVNVRATCSGGRIGRQGSGVFFSGGIDSMYSLLMHREDITHVVFTNAFDYWNRHDATIPVIERWERFASERGKKFVYIETNIRDFAKRRKLSWEFMHGPFLCSMAIALGFERQYIPSSHTYLQLFPWGSHALADPMWSTEGTDIIHDGAERRRSEKTEFISHFQAELNELQVCWTNIQGNCGRCAKCVRTGLTINLLGKQSDALPREYSRWQIRCLYPGDANEYGFTEDIIMLAVNRGNRRIAAALKSYLWIYQIIEHIKGLAKLLMPRRLRFGYRKMRNAKWEESRVELSAKSG